MHLCDTLVYSNKIYKNWKENLFSTKLFGPIKEYVTGVIIDFLDYEFMMKTLRYLNKSFLVFTQENSHYCHTMKRKAYIKANLKEIYEADWMMPILNHPYYTNWTKLTIIYQIWKTKDSDWK